MDSFFPHMKMFISKKNETVTAHEKFHKWLKQHPCKYDVDATFQDIAHGRNTTGIKIHCRNI